MYKKLFVFLDQMILDLFTRELFLIFCIWKNASALPMAPAPVNSINTLKLERSRWKFCTGWSLTCWRVSCFLYFVPAPVDSINTLKQSQQRHCIVNCIKEPVAERKIKPMFTFRLSTIHDETTTVTENYSTSLTTESCNAYSFTVDNQ